MNHAGHIHTLELEQAVSSVRGRGRPRKPDSLTEAQRAKRYRDKRSATQSHWQWLQDAYRELCSNVAQ